MLFDPSFPDRPVDAGAGASRQPPVATVARRRSADCVLTLPDIAEDVPVRASLKWREDTSVDAVVLEQFRHGPLLAADIEAPVSPVDAFQQAFFAWARRQLWNAAPLPGETVIEITRLPLGLEDYCARVADEFAGYLGLADGEGHAPERFSFRFGDVPAEPRGSAMYKLCNLRSQQVQWTLSQDTASTQPVEEATSTDLVQMILERY
jgi:hypothetical protein